MILSPSANSLTFQLSYFMQIRLIAKINYRIGKTTLGKGQYSIYSMYLGRNIQYII
jgi:hypothetical protein